MDDAHSALEALAIDVHRHTIFPLSPPKLTEKSKQVLSGSFTSIPCKPRKKLTNELANVIGSHDTFDTASKCQLLIWSAKDEAALIRILGQYTQYFEVQVHGSKNWLDQLAYTLAARRSAMAWRCFAVVTTESSAKNATWKLQPSKGVRVSRERGLAAISGGQGAQYAKMGV